MRTKVLSPRRMAVVRRHPAVYRLLRWLRYAAGRYLAPVELADGPGRVHRNDFMIAGTDEESMRAYSAMGRATVDVVERFAVAGGLTDLSAKRWLEVGCGYGRVVRFVTERVPPSSVWVTDVIPEAVEFCRQELGVNGIADLGLDESLRGTFDLVYLISVLTHLPPAACSALISQVADLLAPGGVVVATTHGRDLLDHPERYGSEFASQRDALVAAFDRDGACYAPYSHSTDGSYGIAWHSEGYLNGLVAEASAQRLVPALFEKQALDGHQDVSSFRLVSGA